MAPFDLSYWHATTKTYTYFGVFGFFRTFFCQKSDPTMVKSHFKNTMGNPILKAPIFKAKRTKKYDGKSIAPFFKTKRSNKKN